MRGVQAPRFRSCGKGENGKMRKGERGHLGACKRPNSTWLNHHVRRMYLRLADALACKVKTAVHAVVLALDTTACYEDRCHQLHGRTRSH